MQTSIEVRISLLFFLLRLTQHLQLHWARTEWLIRFSLCERRIFILHVRNKWLEIKKLLTFRSKSKNWNPKISKTTCVLSGYFVTNYDFRFGVLDKNLSIFWIIDLHKFYIAYESPNLQVQKIALSSNPNWKIWTEIIKFKKLKKWTNGQKSPIPPKITVEVWIDFAQKIVLTLQKAMKFQFNGILKRPFYFILQFLTILFVEVE